MPQAEQYVETSPLEGDIALLRRYARSKEPAAFVELSRRYAGVVYGTCLRITADVQDAEELTQDCFFELARRATTVRSSVGGWLHSRATHRALNAVRSRNRRRGHERNAATAKEQSNSEVETAWRHLEPLLDQAIDDLPEELRTPIILHFLESRPQIEVALRLGVHQSTVSRRIQEAIEALRARLRESGLVMAVAPLTSLLATHAGPAADPHLLTSLAKIALAGVGPVATGKALGGVATGLAKLSAWGKAFSALVTPIIVQFILGGWWGFLLALALITYIAWRRPRWHEELSIAMGGRGYDYEFFPLVRWTWTTPPAAWRKAMFGSVMSSAMMAGAAAIPLSSSKPAYGFAAMWLLYAGASLFTAARIWIRVHRCGDKGENAMLTEPPPDKFAVVQSVCWTIAAILAITSFAFLGLRGRETGILVAMAVMSLGVIWAVVDTIDRIRRYLNWRKDEGQTQTQSPVPSPCELQRPRTTLVVLVVLLIFAVSWTLPALHQCSQFYFSPRAAVKSFEVLQTEAAWAVLPPLAIIFLIAALRMLSRLRGKIPRLVWSGLVTATAVLATANLALCAGWLIAQGSLPKVLCSSRPQRDMVAISSQLKSSDPKVRVRAAALLGRLADLKKDAAAIPELRKAIDDRDVELRRRVAIALGLLDASDKNTVPVLGEALGDEDQEIRLMAGMALGAIGPAGKNAVPQLRSALSDDDKAVRGMAASALGRIGPAAKDAVPELRSALSDPDDFVRNSAALALSQLGPAAIDAIPELRTALSDTYWLVRSNAANAIGSIGPAAKDAIPELRKTMLADENAQVRFGAAGALQRLGPAAKKATADVQKALHDPNHTVRSVAAYTLGKIASPTESVISDLRTALHDPDQGVRSSAAWSLGQLEPATKNGPSGPAKRIE